MTTRPASGLLALFQQIPDPRGRQGLRHSLPAMLATIVCAVMSGYSSYAAIEQWIHTQQAAFWHLLGFTRRPPTQDGFRKFLNKLNPQDVERVLLQWVAQLGISLPNEETLTLCTLDGKVLRGTRGKWERAWQVITLLDNHTGRICSQAAVSPGDQRAEGGGRTAQVVGGARETRGGRRRLLSAGVLRNGP